MSTIWDVAMNMEQEGIAFYKAQQASTANKQLSGVFGMLAREEQAHLDLFANLQKSAPVTARPDSTLIADVKKEFAKLTADFAATDVIDDATAAYRKALSMEQHAVEYYTGLIAQVKDAAQLTALKIVIAEEKRHVKIFENLIDFVQRPVEWVESAEFNKLEEY